MSIKKNILVWANCQGSAIFYMINKYYSDLFVVKHLTNYEFIRNNLPVPDEIANCDIFLYQRYSDKGDSVYDIDNILKNYLKEDCIKICFPTLHSCLGLFCYKINEPNNAKTIKDGYPFGNFFLGISVITDLLQNYDYKNATEEYKKLIIDEIYCKSQELDFISNEKIQYYHNRTFEFLENKGLSSDVPNLFYFIKENFTKVRLWHNPNHPTGILLHELIKEVFTKLNLIYKEEDSLQNISELDKFLSDWVMPIFPSVKKYYGLTFEDTCSSWYHPDITDSKSYIAKYLCDLYLNDE